MRWSNTWPIAVWLLVLCAAPAARADFTPVSGPAGGLSVDGFAASQGAWLIGLAGSFSAGQARISRDRGQTWTDVAMPAGPSATVGRFSGVSVGPDGAFYVAARYPTAVAPGSYARLLRVDQSSGAATIVGTLPLPAADAALSAPAFDAQGSLWVAWVPNASSPLTVARIAGGAAAETHQAPAPSTSSPNGEIQFRTSGMWVRMGNKTYRLSGGALVLAPQGIPSLEDGQLVVASNQISLDGGRSFASNFQGAKPVEGDPRLLASTNGIIRRYSPAMFSATMQTWTDGGAQINRVVATDGGLVAFSDEWRQPQISGQAWRMLWHPGAVTDPPFATGPLSDTFTGWLTQANAFRAQAGLPPLLGDPAIATAAENHSRYWTLNPHVGDAHSETPGAPGFTGRSPSERCAAAGAPAFCGEVMYSLPNPVPWWVSTAYHGSLIMSPTALSVGGGQVPGGLAVMDGGRGGGLLVGPVVFPNGAYTGALGFGFENPDVALECQRDGQQVSSPLGATITAAVPGGVLSGFTLSPAGGQPLRACVLGGRLLPDDALLPATTYHATVLWQPSPHAAAQQLAWQFTTAVRPERPPTAVALTQATAPAIGWPLAFFPLPQTGTTVAPRPCTPSITPTAARVTRPATVAVRVRGCGTGVATAGIYRLRARNARERRALSHRRVTLRAAGSVTMRLATRRVRTGRFALRVTLKAAKPKKLTTTITIAAARRRR